MVKKVTTKKTGLKVWYLKRKEEAGYGEWEDVVVVATNEQEARSLTLVHVQIIGDEGDWLDLEFASCELLSPLVSCDIQKGVVTGFMYEG